MTTYVYSIDNNTSIQVRDGELYSIIRNGDMLNIFNSMGFSLRHCNLVAFNDAFNEKEILKANDILYTFIGDRNWGIFLTMLIRRSGTNLGKALKNVGYKVK